ncbi:MAG TPA: response regulator [Gemmatimonadales bacterium]|nr:response regulator [Gemmatimonadales bacterium]
MPRETIARGAADLVLPLSEIAPVVTQVLGGGDLPRPRAEIEAAETLLSGDGEVMRLLRDIDWSRTSLGPISSWPVSLRTTLRLVLDSRMPMSVLWGPDLIQLYNDAYRLLMGPKHPAGLGQPSRLAFAEVWHLNQPIYQRVLAGESVTLTDALYPITRRDKSEDAWLDVCFTPVRGEVGEVAGVLATAVETTARVLSKRRLRTLQGLAAATAGATHVQVAMQRALAALGGGGADGAAEDLPFVLGYLVDDRSRQAQLAASAGVEPGGPMAPRTIDLRAPRSAWPLGRVLEDEAGRYPVLLEELATRFPGSRVSPAGLAPSTALLLPLCPIADEPPAGVLVCGINPRLVLDETYRGFLQLVAAAVSAGLAEAQIRQKEHVRLERMAELDRAKTEFFSNVSHEFRTPLTLMLGPLEELSRRVKEFPEPLGEEVQVAARNARRLLNQVNTLLDFSQAEARRLRPQLEPTDLAALTQNVASVFRSAAERAGLGLRVECPPLPEPIWVDRQMWEKIVSNLLSNALKFTFAGEIAVELTARSMHAELVVRDSGTGIPRDEQPHLFKRFHRVQGRQGRTSEGSGIGLALVYELVRLHHGRVRVDSQEGRGSSFTVWVPMGRRARAEMVPEPEPGTEAAHSAKVAAALAQDAASWTTEEASAPADVSDDLLGPPEPTTPQVGPVERARVLVVDDNADLREYLRRLLQSRWDVTLAADGPAALAALQKERPSVVLTDVMMPGLDGFELLSRIRADPELRYLPVVLVTARAGEKSAIEGLQAGADDYIAKPFSSRELVARVQAAIGRSRVEAALRTSEAQLAAELADARRLQQVSSLLIKPGDGAALPEQILDAAMTLTAADFGSVQLLDADGRLDLVAWRNFHPESAEFWRKVSVGSGTVCGAALRRGERVIVTDVETDEAEALLGAEDVRHFRISGIRAIQSTPLVTREGRLVGMFSTQWRHTHVPDERQLRLIDILGRQAADFLERRHATAALLASEERQRQMANVPGVGILTFDEATGTLLDSNDSFLAISGYTRDQIERRELTWQRMTPPEYMAVSEGQILRLQATGLIGPYQKEYFRADGSRSWLLFTGASMGDGRIVEYCIDLGERRLEEQIELAGRVEG